MQEKNYVEINKNILEKIEIYLCQVKLNYIQKILETNSAIEWEAYDLRIDEIKEILSYLKTQLDR